MEYHPLISVIIPVYNVEKYIRQCVDSVVNQTYDNLEIILVNDGSQDRSGKICDAYADQDSRIQVIHQKNSGISAARNAGLNFATGEYVMFLDSDDWLRADAVEIMLSKALANGAQMTICNITLSYEADFSGHKTSTKSPLTEACFSAEEVIAKLIEPESWYYVTMNKLCHISLFNNLRFPEGFLHEDAAVAHRIIGRCTKIVTITEPLYFYRQSNSSIMGSEFSIRRTDNLSSLADRIEYAHEMKWKMLEEKTLIRYFYHFMDWYFRFQKVPENMLYFSRMEKSLKRVLPYALRSHSLNVNQKLYMVIIRFSPDLYAFAKKIRNYLKGKSTE